MTNYFGNPYQTSVIEGSVIFPDILTASDRSVTITKPLTFSSITGSSATFSSITGTYATFSSITGTSATFSSITGSVFSSELTIPVSTTGTANLGSMFFSSTDKKLYIYDGATGWIRTANAFT